MEFFETIKSYIDAIKDLFAKIGETGFIQAILGALKNVLGYEKEEEAATIIGEIADTIE